MVFTIDRTSQCQLPLDIKSAFFGQLDYDENGNYTIEINSLEELMLLIKENGKIVLGDGWLEIYDTYRE